MKEMREALEGIELLSTNHGGWFEQDPFGEYAKLGDIARQALSAPPATDAALDLMKELARIRGDKPVLFTLESVGPVGTVLEQQHAAIVAALETAPLPATDTDGLVERLTAAANNSEDADYDYLFVADLREAAALITSLTAQNEAMREALEPFAKMAGQYDPPEGDDSLPLMRHDGDELNIGHLRDARLASQGGSGS